VHSLKESGHSWREITKILFESDPDLQEEFGVKEFSELKSNQREHLQHRIEQGHRSYRRRMGKSDLPESMSKPA
jgi:hypothetical protein